MTLVSKPTEEGWAQAANWAAELKADTQAAEPSLCLQGGHSHPASGEANAPNSGISGFLGPSLRSDSVSSYPLHPSGLSWSDAGKLIRLLGPRSHWALLKAFIHSLNLPGTGVLVTLFFFLALFLKIVCCKNIQQYKAEEVKGKALPNSKHPS